MELKNVGVEYNRNSKKIEISKIVDYIKEYLLQLKNLNTETSEASKWVVGAVDVERCLEKINKIEQIMSSEENPLPQVIDMLKEFGHGVKMSFFVLLPSKLSSIKASLDGMILCVEPFAEDPDHEPTPSESRKMNTLLKDFNSICKTDYKEFPQDILDEKEEYNKLCAYLRKLSSDSDFRKAFNDLEYICKNKKEIKNSSISNITYCKIKLMLHSIEKAITQANKINSLLKKCDKQICDPKKLNITIPKIQNYSKLLNKDKEICREYLVIEFTALENLLENIEDVIKYLGDKNDNTELTVLNSSYYKNLKKLYDKKSSFLNVRNMLRDSLN